MPSSVLMAKRHGTIKTLVDLAKRECSCGEVKDKTCKDIKCKRDTKKGGEQYE